MKEIEKRDSIPERKREIRLGMRQPSTDRSGATWGERGEEKLGEDRDQGGVEGRPVR